MSDWKQPSPTKPFAVWMDGAWYGEGDTPAAAWNSARRQTNADYCAYGATMYRKLKRFGQVKQTEPA